MRTAVALVCLVALLVGASTLARGENGARDPDLEALQKQVEVLEQQVAYLLQREASLTLHALRSEERGRAVQDMVARMRAQGFQNRAIPAESRETLLAGLAQLGKDLQEELPKVTKEQMALLRRAR